MAHRQSRRAVSLNREVYVEASKFAFRKDVTLSQLTTDALRSHLAKHGVTIPPTQHVPIEIAEHAAEAVRHGIVRREQRRHQRKRHSIGEVASARVVDTFLRVKRPGPIRQALGDGHANALGEPHWYQMIPFGRPARRAA